MRVEEATALSGLDCTENMESRGWHLAFLCVAILTFLCRCAQGQAHGDCPADGRTWMYFGESCYYFIHGEKEIAKSYKISEATELCKSISLLTVSSAVENRFIVDNSPMVWKNSINVWLGMYYNTDVNAFTWNDESPLTFNNWEEEGDEDPEEVLIDTCVTLHTASGMWENVSCAEQAEHGVVCKTPQKAMVPVKKNGSPVLSALVIVSVILILGISAFVWFIQQRSNSGSTLLPSFEYHPPFRAPCADQTCLVEAEEIEETS